MHPPSFTEQAVARSRDHEKSCNGRQPVARSRDYERAATRGSQSREAATTNDPQQAAADYEKLAIATGRSVVASFLSSALTIELFVRWQMRKLKARGKMKSGERYTARAATGREKAPQRALF